MNDIQEKIRRLSAQALRTPELPNPVRKPVTPTPGQVAEPRPAGASEGAAAAPTPTPTPAVAVAPVVASPAPVVASPATLEAAPTTPAAEANDGKEEEDLGVLIDERNKRLKQTWAWRRRAVVFGLLAVVAGCGAWYASSPSLQAKMQLLGENFRKGKQDMKTLGSIVETYQKEVDKVKVRGEQIDAATTSLGVDPKSVAGDEDPNMEKEMKQLMGEDAITPAERDRLLRQKFGGVEKLIGHKEDKATTAHPPATR